MEEEDGMTPSENSGGAMLRKLVSVRSKNSANAIKDPNYNRMTFSDEEIVPQVKK